ncbi:MAG TPA: T9SS type A sorting domain-containing protein [Clostridiales bacterium]|nr:T9SS type A sorting domain-containing protein [Clostridiales bacterium]
MKKLMLVVLVLSAISGFASNTKVIVFGIVDLTGNEYTNESITNVTYKAWLQRIPGEVIEQSDGLAQCEVMMFPNNESPIRGVCMVDLQHFSSWDAGDILYVLIRDYNTDKKWFYETQAEYTIEDSSSEWVYLGFEDLGLEDSGQPWMLAIPSGTESKTFTYSCVTTTGTDLNFVGIPVRNGWDNASDLDPLGTNIDAVSKWNAAVQGWETVGHHSYFGWLTDFPVVTGGAYMINAKNDFDFIVEGDSVNVQYNLVTTEGTDNNPICVPLSKVGLTDTELLGNDIAVCNAIAKYDNSTQQFSTSAKSIFGWFNIFPVEPGMALLASVTESVVWPSSKGMTEISDLALDNNLKSKGLTGGGPRVVYCHIIDNDGSELDFSTAPYANIEFKVWNTENPSEILDHNSPGCGFTMVGGIYSVLYFNPGNLPYNWESGDQINILVEDLSRPYMIPDTYWGDMRSFTIDNSSSPIINGFESLVPGTGVPMQILMPTSIENELAPAETALRQNYPNPFNPETIISFSLPKDEQVSLSVFNTIGELVKEILNGKISAGNHSLNFSASDLNSGVYYYTLETGSTKISKKMLLIK